jgi:sn-glycerol 3-phosphate transport system permease protein
MATSDVLGIDDVVDAAPPPKTTVGRSAARHTWGLVGQYGMLCALSLLVLGPLFLTIIQALSPPFTYVNEGRPLHPVAVDWKDRTWFSGGPVSFIGRTLVVVFLFAWLQKAASGTSWRQLGTPARLVAVVGGTVALAVAIGPVFGSLHDADGSSLALFLVAAAVVAATQLWGYLAPARPTWIAVLMAVLTGLGIVGTAVLFAGPEVWTKSWGRYDLGPAMGRSLVMAIIITTLQVGTAIMSAYAFVFLRFPFKRILFALFMATLLLPLEVTLVGNVATIRQLEWTNTMQALVLPFGATALGTFLIRQGFRGLPSEIQDATRLDGYGHVAFLTKFAVPLTRPVIASFTVISALGAWNQYLWPRAVIESNAFNTLQIQLRQVSAGEVANANEAIASALVAAVPVVILLIAFQRQIIRGLTAGAVK